jgi:molybdate transport system ATP-binding protein
MLSVQLNKRRGEFNLSLQFTVAESGVVALFGHSGCGKSTAVNLLAGLLQADSGYIQLEDTLLLDTDQGINLPAEQRRIGYVFQNARLFPHYRVAGNLRYGLRRAKQTTPSFHFDNIVQLLGLDRVLQRRPAQLSGGEQQRVALGRALLAQPRLLLLDEPLASLDLARREEVLPYLERVRDQLKIPMVYVSHQFEEVLRLATQVVLMKHGAILAQGDLTSISVRPELRELLGVEALGAVVEGVVREIHHDSGLACISIGTGQINVEALSLLVGQRVRLQLLARDLILALTPPQGLSVRNRLQGVITQLTPDNRHAVLVTIDIGGATLLARVTSSAATELQLHTGQPIWTLVKSVSLRGHAYSGNGLTSI